jgi:hypothetical protein
MVDDEWAHALRIDVEFLAANAFGSCAAGHRVVAIFNDALERIETLPHADPENPAWRRIALAVALIVCEIERRDDAFAFAAPLDRLRRFLEDNDDLLESDRAVNY